MVSRRLSLRLRLSFVSLHKNLQGLKRALWWQRDSGNWRRLWFSNSCLLGTGGARCSYCLPLLISLPCRDASWNSRRQVCEYAYFSSVWQRAPRIARRPIPVPPAAVIDAGAWEWSVLNGEAARWRSPSPTGAAWHQMHNLSDSAHSQEPDSCRRLWHVALLQHQVYEGLLTLELTNGRCIVNLLSNPLVTIITQRA